MLKQSRLPDTGLPAQDHHTAVGREAIKERIQCVNLGVTSDYVATGSRGTLGHWNESWPSSFSSLGVMDTCHSCWALPVELVDEESVAYTLLAPRRRDADLAGHPCDDPDLDEETLARHRGLHRGARRPVVREVGTVRVVERVEVGCRAQEDERVERVRERCPGLLEDRADVVEDAARLRRDVATARLVGFRIERDLPGDKHEVAVAERLRVRQAGVRRPCGVDDLSLRHFSSYALLPRVAIASSPSTVPSSWTRTYLSWRLIVVSQWLGTSQTTSP